jgi:hypothetical protein
VSTIKMDLVADDRRGSPGKRVKWVEDFDLEPETPGIMASRRMRVAGAPRPSIPSSPPPYAARGIRPFMPPTELCRTGLFSPGFTVSGV